MQWSVRLEVEKTGPGGESMHPGFVRVCGALLALLFAVQPTQAVLDGDTNFFAALIIGNSKYIHAENLPNAVSDSRLLADSFKRAGYTRIVHVENAGMGALWKAVAQFSKLAQHSDVAIVYYAGHGIEADGINWIIPIDAKIDSAGSLKNEAVNMRELLQAMTGAKIRVLALDACRNNPFGSSWQPGSRKLARGLAEAESSDTLILYATAPGEVASDGDGANGPFAISLANRLVTSEMTLQRLGALVRDDVEKATAKEQRPFVSTGVSEQPIWIAPWAETFDNPPLTDNR